MTSKPASRKARAITLAPRSCPSSPGLATRIRIGWSAVRSGSALTSFPLIMGEEPLPGLAAEPAGGDHATQQRRGPVLVLAQIVLQHLHDAETNVQADQVCQRQRPHRV